MPSLFSDSTFVPSSFEALELGLREALIGIGADCRNPPVFLFKLACASGRLDLAAQILPGLDAKSLMLAASRAIENGNDPALLLILRHAAQADRFHQQPIFHSVLFSAVYYDRSSAASLILAEMPGLSLDPPNMDGKTGILNLAAARGAASLLSLILKSSKSTPTQQSLGSALASASESGQAASAAILIPLMDSRLGSAAPSLLEHALKSAAAHGHANIVQLLLEAGLSSPDGCSRALASASRRGHPACVELILPFADASFDGHSAIVDAIDNECCQCLALLLPSFVPGGPGVACSLSSLACFARRALSMRAAAVIEAFAEARAIADCLPTPDPFPNARAPRL